MSLYMYLGEKAEDFPDEKKENKIVIEVHQDNRVGIIERRIDNIDDVLEIPETPSMLYSLLRRANWNRNTPT